MWKTVPDLMNYAYFPSLCCFALWFHSCDAPLAFIHSILEFWAWISLFNHTLNEPKGNFGLVLPFWPLLQNIPDACSYLGDLHHDFFFFSNFGKRKLKSISQYSNQNSANSDSHYSNTDQPPQISVLQSLMYTTILWNSTMLVLILMTDMVGLVRASPI